MRTTRRMRFVMCSLPRVFTPPLSTIAKTHTPQVGLDLMVGEKKAISRGVFRYNGPCGCQDGHCAVRKSVIYIYSIYICAQPSNRPLEHLFVVQPSYARPTHAHVRIGVWYHPHGACRGFWLSIFGTRLFWPSLQCAPKPMKLVHRCHLRGWFRG